MSHKTKPKTPSYSRHKASGQAVVRLNGCDLYLGHFGSDESRERYDQLVAQWLVNGRKLAPNEGTVIRLQKARPRERQICAPQ